MSVGFDSSARANRSSIRSSRLTNSYKRVRQLVIRASRLIHSKLIPADSSNAIRSSRLACRPVVLQRTSMSNTAFFSRFSIYNGHRCPLARQIPASSGFLGLLWTCLDFSFWKKCLLTDTDDRYHFPFEKMTPMSVRAKQNLPRYRGRFDIRREMDIMLAS